MSLDSTAVIAEVRDLVADLTGMRQVFASSENDENRLPLALNAFPAALVFPGQTLKYVLTQPRLSHEYEVRILIVESGMDIGARAYSVMPFVDRVIEKFAANVKLAGGTTSTVVKCLFNRCSGFVGIDYANVDYLGYDITLRVEEQTNISAAPGS